MALPDAYLGSDLIAFFDQGYTFGTGTFVDAKGNATSLTEATSGDRPTWDTTTLPSGRGILSFPGGGTHRLEGGNLASGLVPAYSGGRFYIEFLVLKRASGGTSTEQIVNYDGWENLSIDAGQIYRSGSWSDSTHGTGITRHIGVFDSSTGAYTQYLNDVAQSDLGATDNSAGGIRTQWMATRYVGNRNNKSVPFGGLIGCLGWAAPASWSRGATTALDAAIDEWINVGVGGSPQNVFGSGIVSAEDFGRATISGGFRPKRRFYRAFPDRIGARGTLLVFPSSASSLLEREFFETLLRAAGIASAEALGSPTLSLGAGGSLQTIGPASIASAESFGSSRANFRAVASAIASGEAFGSLRSRLYARPTGIVSAEALGSSKLSRNAKPTGIASAETHGAARLGLRALPTGIATGEALGSPKLNRRLAPTAIASGEAHGAARLALRVLPNGLPSAAAFGTPSATAGGVTIVPGGIASANAFGAVLATSGGTVIAPSGVASALAFGSSRLAMRVAALGVPSSAAFGTLRTSLRLLPSGVASATAFGSQRLRMGVSPSGIASAGAFGGPTILAGMVTIAPSSIASREAFASVLVTAGATFVVPASIVGAEAFGSARSRTQLVPVGIVSAEALGSAELEIDLVVSPSSIESAQAFGASVLSGGVPPFDIPQPIIRWHYRPATRIVVTFRPATIVTARHRPATTITVRQKNMPLYVDDKAEVVFTFQHPETKAYIDPPEILLVVQSPAQKRTGTSTTYTFGVGNVISRSSVGHYMARIPCTESGAWEGAPKCTGEAAASDRIYFDVEAKL